jgi:hypothetical protein
LNWIKRKWNHIQADSEKVKKFGFILAGILFTLGLIAYFRGHQQYWFEWPLAALVLFLSFSAVRILTYIYRAWMLAAEGISWVLLRLILGIFYYLILSPVGFGMRLAGKDILDEQIDQTARSYWKKHTATPREQYERLF